MKKTLYKGELVIRQGDIKDKYLYVLEKGKLAVQRAVNGVIIDCGYLRDGDVFGEISMIIGVERAATVMVASEEAIVNQLDRNGFLDLISRKPDIAWKVLTSLAIRTQALDELQGQISDSKILRKILLGKD